MMMPKLFGENLFDDDWMDFPFEHEFFGKKIHSMVKMQRI